MLHCVYKSIYFSKYLMALSPCGLNTYIVENEQKPFVIHFTGTVLYFKWIGLVNV